MSGLPAAVRDSVEAARPGRSVAALTPVTGGCVNHGARLRWDDGVEHFLKWNPSAPPGIFVAEADGLGALAEAAARGGAGLRVPEPVDHGETPAGAWLLCAWVGPGREASGFPARFGQALARLHDAPAAADFGWERDNWIGSLPQENRPGADWPAFWRDRRITPQLERARARGRCTDPIFDRFVDRLPEALADVGAPSLLHGDLWSGNAWAGPEGAPVVADPAVYRGHGEVDLAMTELFGGFGPDFYRGYARVRPIDGAYESHRRDTYQLYYLLVHVNLFGASYEPGARAAADRVRRALG